MPKIFTKTLILTIIIAILLAPISPVLKVNKNNDLALGVKVNKVKAEDLKDCLSSSTFKAKATSDTVILDYRIKLNNDYKKKSQMIGCYDHIEGYDTIKSGTLGGDGRKEGLFLFYYEKGSKNIINMSFDKLSLFFDPSKTENPVSTAPAYKADPYYFTFKPNTEYVAGLAIIESDHGIPYLDDNGEMKQGWGDAIFGVDLDNDSIIKTDSFTTPKDFNLKGTTMSEIEASQEAGGEAELDLGCTSFADISLSSCVAQLTNIVWMVSAEIMTLSGIFLDFFVYYSTNSDSYKNTFVEKAWGAVRDIANIFFIIALLYVAIKTILGLNVTDNKKLVGAVIIIALIINFSLFTTKVVIDTSNILAKVFYNNISTVDKKSQAVSGDEGEKSVSVGLVQKFKPQNIVTDDEYKENHWTYILITLVLIFVCLYTSYIFFSVGLLFVGRVISLWISMIFSPLAFVSYSVPFEIPGFGHKKWWDDLLKNAFLAPLFVFMLYIVILFAGFLKNIISYADSTDPFVHIMNLLVPFIIIAVLLKKSKDLAVEYSGEMGKAIQGLGATVGGFALGAATGGVAMLGTSTIGKYAQHVANKDELRAKAAAGDTSAQKKLARANYFAGKSFDVRQTGAGKAFSKGTGLDLNKGTGALRISTEKLKGGQKARAEKKAEKEEEKLKSYEMTPGAEKTQNNIAQKYNEDKEKAKKESDGNLPEKKEKWQKEYESKARENKFSVNPVNEKAFEENYRKNNPPPVSSFNEEAFKENYIKDNKIKNGVEKVDMKEENKNRREAYTWSREHPNEKKNENNETVKKDFRDFLNVWKEGIKDMVTKPGGLTTTAITGAMTGGLGLIVTPLIGGLAHAIKEVVKAQIPINKELIGRIGKEKSYAQKLTEIVKKMAEGDEKAEADLAKEIEKTKKEETK